MANPMRIRAQAKGDKATVRILMAHEMESGQRKDDAGNIAPAWHIQEVTATHNGNTVLTAEWGPGVAKNPFLQFVLKNAKVGDKIGVRWKDNRGDTRSDEATVS
jgi:sulfur-oxidizing protein SoxZ